MSIWVFSSIVYWPGQTSPYTSDQHQSYCHLDEVPVLPPDSADLKHVSNVISCCLHLINKQTMIWLLTYDGHHNITINPKSAKCKFNIKAGSIYRPVWCYLVDEIQPSTVHPDFHQLPSKRCLQLAQAHYPWWLSSLQPVWGKNVSFQLRMNWSLNEPQEQHDRSGWPWWTAEGLDQPGQAPWPCRANICLALWFIAQLGLLFAFLVLICFLRGAIK